MQVHLIQSFITKLTDDLHFGPMETEIKANFDKYYLSIHVFFGGFGILITFHIKENVLIIYFELLYSEPYPETVQSKFNI